MDNIPEIINSLKQRGDRMLSMVDLINAETVDLKTAGWLVRKMQASPSVLSGAVPGGVGKTTLLGALMCFLPPETKIEVVSSPEVLYQNTSEKTTFLVHEFGAGPYFGYVWGSDVKALSEKIAEGNRLLATLHADDAEQAISQLSKPPNNADETILRQIDLMVFINFAGGVISRKRKLIRAYDSENRNIRKVFEYNSSTDITDSLTEDITDCSREEEWLSQITDEGVTAIEQVRTRFLKDFY